MAEVKDPIRVLVVDDDPLALAALAALAMIIDGTGGLKVVGEAGDGADVPAAVDAGTPDVVLMDIRMPVLDGLAATEQLRARPNPPEIIVLTGASGFLLKHTPADILRAIFRVSEGEPILSPTVTRQLIAHLGHTGADAGSGTPPPS